jgi:hypothetical protein
MSQKSSVSQATKSVSQVLMPDTRIEALLREVLIVSRDGPTLLRPFFRQTTTSENC